MFDIFVSYNSLSVSNVLSHMSTTYNSWGRMVASLQVLIVGCLLLVVGSLTHTQNKLGPNTQKLRGGSGAILPRPVN